MGVSNVKVPAAQRNQTATGTWQMTAGSDIGPPGPPVPQPLPSIGVTSPIPTRLPAIPKQQKTAGGSEAEHLSDEEWQKQLAQRERMDDMLAGRTPPTAPVIPSQRAQPPAYVSPPAALAPAAKAAAVDTSNLPGSFAISVERLPNSNWRVRVPAVHVGLYLVGERLEDLLRDLPAMLGNLIELDGEQPVKRRASSRKSVT